MRWNIISNITNGVGLQADYELLKALLEAQGHRVRGVHIREPHTARPAEINLFLELLEPRLLRLAPRNWVIPNPEWWFRHWHGYLPRFERVLCKTRDAERIYQRLAGDRVRYVGFKSKDRLLPAVPRERAFLHLVGKSSAKNTEAVMQAWKLGNLPYPLLIISRAHDFQWGPVRSVKHLPEPELAVEMNRRIFHLCPSAYEGFGHGLHESAGVGGVIITTNQPPMNEIGCTPPELLVRAIRSTPRHTARLFTVHWQDVARAARAAWELPGGKLEDIQACARQRFEDGRAEFERLFLAEVEALNARKEAAA
jgi:hypothetical protein